MARVRSRPTGFTPLFSPDARTFSLQATLANTGVSDANGPLEVFFQILEVDGNGHPVVGTGAAETIVVPASDVIRGTASTAGLGGSFVTKAAVGGTPFRPGESYNVLIIIDPNGKYAGGVVAHGDFIWQGQITAP